MNRRSAAGVAQIGKWIDAVILESKKKGYITALTVAGIRAAAGYEYMTPAEAISRLKTMRGIRVTVIGDIGRRQGQVGREAKKYRVEYASSPEGQR